MEFEEKLNELEKIINNLESGDVKFNDAVALFERGAMLCRELSVEFEKANGKIAILKESISGLIEEEMKKNENI